MEEKLSLLISVKQPSKEKSDECKPGLYDKVKYAIDCLQGDYNNYRALAYIVRVYQFVCRVPEEQHTPIQKKCMRMLIPELEIHAPHLIDSAMYLQYKQDRDWTENPDIAPNYIKGR